MNDYIKVGKIVNTHGVRGCVKCIPLTDDMDRFDELKSVITEKDNVRRKIRNVWYKKSMVYLELDGINTMDDALKLKDTYISIQANELKALPKDTYYIFQLEGLEVYSTDGEYIGKISTVFQTGANDVYEVKNNNKTFLIPAIKDVIKEVNINDNKVVIKVIEGLL